MKTIKTLKITSILNGIFCLCCVAFVICLLISQHYDMNIITAIGVIATFGWMCNPSPIISFILCLVFFLEERRSPEMQEIIGKKYIWIFIWPVITTLFYFTALGFLVEMSGI